MYNDPPAKRFISAAGPLAGYYNTVDDCMVGQCGQCRKDPFSEETENNFALCSWWRDPYKVSEFELYNYDLALLDNVKDFDDLRKQNILSLD